jgi:hypothetical protein
MKTITLAALAFLLLASCGPNMVTVPREKLLNSVTGDPTSPPTLPPDLKPIIDWAQPPVACVEEIVPSVALRPCPDLSSVEKPLSDWPANLEKEEIQYWKSSKTWMKYCRGKELLRREEINPGSQKASQLELSWMYVDSVNDYDTKVRAIYQSSRQWQIPAQVLAGALTQESLFAKLGITTDGENYSCGIGQINVQEWCHWASKLDSDQKQKIGWPETVECSKLPANTIKPFYEIAIQKLAGRPFYKLTKGDFAHITLPDVIAGLPEGSEELQNLRFQSAMSFINNCQHSEYGILAKASQLKLIYDRYVPKGLKNIQQYPDDSGFKRFCADNGDKKNYPLHVGWLIAVGIYNAGPRAVDSLAHYHDLKLPDMQNPENFKNILPVDLVEAFYWSGQYNSVDDRIHFKLLNGQDTSWLWFKTCVLQRHMARVVQHSTLPLIPKFIDSLENGITCAKSEFADGQLIKSGVPEFRQRSTGRKQTN